MLMRTLGYIIVPLALMAGVLFLAIGCSRGDSASYLTPGAILVGSALIAGSNRKS